ncbi:MAG: FAD-binding oxidoreductase [Rhodospirillales bacterium]|nr:FAD-binding oxidoreductase [Rhodospirillales bacterium]
MPKAPNVEGLKLTPYWWESAPSPESDHSDIPVTADVGIVGAGFAGMMAALTLARAGRSVVVFDALKAGAGGSSRNGGICSGNLKFSLSGLIGKFGLEKGKDIFQEGINARSSLRKLIEDEGIDCGFKMTGRFDGAMHVNDYEQMGRESDLMNKHFDLGVYLVPRDKQHEELGTDFYKGGQVRPDIGGAQPAELHRGIYQRAVEAGVRVVDETEITSIVKGNSDFTLSWAKGSIVTGHCIVATNGYTDKVTSWLRRRIVAVPSQLIATDELDQGLINRLMPKGRMIGETRNIFNYYRPSPDGKRIIFGGRRGADTDDDMQKCLHLYHNLVEIFPELEGVRLSHTWWGYTGHSFNYLPHLTVHDGIHYATGFCGSGVVWAPWLGKKAALMIIGDKENARSNFDEMPFPTRPFYNGNPWFLPAVIGWYSLKDRMNQGRKH